MNHEEMEFFFCTVLCFCTHLGFRVSHYPSSGTLYTFKV
jgi:hypothetical protein